MIYYPCDNISGDIGVALGFTSAEAMKKTLLLLILISLGCVAFAQQPLMTVGAWMPVNAKWQHAPPDAALNLLTASTTVLYFQPNGKMIKIGCVVNRESGTFAISAGDGQVLSSGDWQEEKGEIVARSRVVMRTVQRTGEELPGPWNQDVLTIKDHELLLKGVRYRRVPQLDKSASEMVPRPGPSAPGLPF
jgi:hypothetical protein